MQAGWDFATGGVGLRTILVALLISLLALSVSAQDKQSQDWLLFEQGNASMSAREFGKALQYYKDAIAAAGIFPEAEMAIGDVYFEEGEFDLAANQYQKAYNQRKGFYISDSQYDVLYKIARLYESQELYKLMEDRLVAIVADDKHFVETATSRLRTQIEKNYLDKGLDHVLLLYRFDPSFAVKAHSKLGWFYYRTGRFSQSISQLLYSVIYDVSEINAYIRDRDINYEFASLKDVLAAVEKSSDMQGFVREVDLYKDLYYLAGATFADGYPQHALDLWGLISGFASSGTYQDLSRRQVKSPRIEPLLGSSGKLQGQ
jgi:tetratricopeptide (TPR) repeat protein